MQHDSDSNTSKHVEGKIAWNPHLKTYFIGNVALDSLVGTLDQESTEYEIIIKEKEKPILDCGKAGYCAKCRGYKECERPTKRQIFTTTFGIILSPGERDSK